MCKTQKIMRYSVPPGDWTFLKGYRFLSFGKNMGKKISKNTRKKRKW